MTNHHQNPYGVGIAYRSILHDDVLRERDEIDLLEIPTEDYIVRERRIMTDPQLIQVNEALAAIPAVAHGISMSIGSVEPADEPYLKRTREFLDDTGLNVFSEHLAFHRMEDVDLTLFLCMPFEQVSVRWLAQQYKYARSVLGRDFALENVSYYFPVPGCGLSETEFLNRLCAETSCSLLIDVTNIFNNAENHGFDAIEFIHRLPADRISQLHLAGGHRAEGMWQDSHSAKVMDGVWDLYEEILKVSPVGVTILERDSNFHPFEYVMRDIRKAREIFYRHRPASAPALSNNAIEIPAAPVPEPDDEIFVELRNFQRALMREITNSDFRQRLRTEPEKVYDELPMSSAWRNFWRDCLPERIALLADKWEGIERENRQFKELYRRFELRQWQGMEAMGSL